MDGTRKPQLYGVAVGGTATPCPPHTRRNGIRTADLRNSIDALMTMVFIDVLRGQPAFPD